MSWENFEQSAPELAVHGKVQLANKIAYLATIKRDGSPRIHPVRPFIGAGKLFIFIHQASPKGNDLHRDGRFALHCSVHESNGLSGEFMVTGCAKPVTDLRIRGQAHEVAGHVVPPLYDLFEFSIESALSVDYDEDRLPVRRRWHKNQDDSSGSTINSRAAS